MFEKSKINKNRLKETISSFRVDYSQIMGGSDAKRLSGTGESSSLENSINPVLPRGWFYDLLPKNIANNIGEIPEQVAFYFTTKQFTSDEKKAVEAFFDVDEETCKRRLNLLERVIEKHFPDFATKLNDLKNDPIVEILMELINPVNASIQATKHVKEQREIKAYMDSKKGEGVL